MHSKSDHKFGCKVYHNMQSLSSSILPIIGMHTANTVLLSELLNIYMCVFKDEVVYYAKRNVYKVPVQ